MDYKEYWEEIHKNEQELKSLMNSYWHEYSNLGTWQFWVVLIFLVIPFIILYFTVDRKRLFEVFFFGYTVNLLWTYIGTILERGGQFIHTYFLTPLLPFGVTMNTSLLPIGFLLVYQYCTNTNKNFYLYATIVSAIFAFGLTTLEQSLGLLEFRKGIHQFHIFLIDIVIVFVSYWFTKLMLKMKERI